MLEELGGGGGGGGGGMLATTETDGPCASWRSWKASLQLQPGRGLFTDKEKRQSRTWVVGGVDWGLFIDSNFQVG